MPKVREVVARIVNVWFEAVVVIVPQVAPHCTLPETMMLAVPPEVLRVPLVTVKLPITVRVFVRGDHEPPEPLKVT